MVLRPQQAPLFTAARRAARTGQSRALVPHEFRQRRGLNRHVRHRRPLQLWAARAPPGQGRTRRDDRRAAPSRARRQRRPSSTARSAWRTRACRSSTWPAASSRSHNEDGTRLGRLQRRDLQLRRAARRPRARAATASAPHSDTEVIVHLYEEHGDDFVDHLNGQFAIALWDARAAAPGAGARPRRHPAAVLHARPAGGWSFASEVKALFALPEVPRRLDPRGAGRRSSRFWSPLRAAHACSRASQALPPGHCMVGRRRRRAHARATGTGRFPERDAPRRAATSDCAEELRALLIDAVRLQLRADVPVGAYLSGGLDSSIITTHHPQPHRHAAAHLLARPSRTPSSTRARTSSELVRHLRHRPLVACAARARDIGAAFPRAIWHTETPMVRTAPAPMMLLAGQRARSRLQGRADRRGRRRGVRRLRPVQGSQDPPLLARAAAVAVAPAHARAPVPLPAAFAGRRPRVHAALLRRGLRARSTSPCFAHMPRWTTTARARCSSSRPDCASARRRWDPHAALRADAAGRHRRAGRRWRATSTSRRTRCCPATCCRRRATAWRWPTRSRARFPFLDHRVIEFANRLPPQLQAARPDARSTS